MIIHSFDSLPPHWLVDGLLFLTHDIWYDTSDVIEHLSSMNDDVVHVSDHISCISYNISLLHYIYYAYVIYNQPINQSTSMNECMKHDDYYHNSLFTNQYTHYTSITIACHLVFSNFFGFATSYINCYCSACHSAMASNQPKATAWVSEAHPATATHQTEEMGAMSDTIWLTQGKTHRDELKQQSHHAWWHSKSHVCCNSQCNPFRWQPHSWRWMEWIKVEAI